MPESAKYPLWTQHLFVQPVLNASAVHLFDGHAPLTRKEMSYPFDEDNTLQDLT